MQSREQLISLFYYMGMLTFGPRPPGTAVPHLVIPNRVIRELQWEYLALAMKDQECIWIDTLDLEKALEAMAMNGDIRPLVSQFRGQVVKRIGTKDLRQFNEKVLKLMLLAYISQSRMFHILSEKEFSGGYCDLFLGLSQYVPAARFAWMLGQGARAAFDAGQGAHGGGARIRGRKRCAVPPMASGARAAEKEVRETSGEQERPEDAQGARAKSKPAGPARQAIAWYLGCRQGQAVVSEADGRLPDWKDEKAKRLRLMDLGEEPSWPHLAGVEASDTDMLMLPFCPRWVECPRVHHLVPLSNFRASPNPTRQPR